MISPKALCAILLTLGTSFGAQAADSGVLGFQAWKSGRIEEARNILERLQMDAQLDKAPAVDRSPVEKLAKNDRKTAERKSMKSSRSDQRVQQAQLNLEIAKEFAVNDYFILYLSQFKTRDSFIDAAKKLSPEEAADLMVAYQKHLASGADTSDLSVPTTLPPKIGSAATPSAASRTP